MLLITDAEVRRVLQMRDCIEAMERVFREEARGIAVNRPRVRYKVPPDLLEQGYMANIISGEACKKRRLGRELPAEWFGTDLSEWTEKGFYPSP